MPACGYQLYLLVFISITHSFTALTREYRVEHSKIKFVYIHARTCNILYILFDFLFLIWISVCKGVYGRNKTWRRRGRHDRAGTSVHLHDVDSLHIVQFYRAAAIFSIVARFSILA